MTEAKRGQHGGKREGAGRPSITGEEMQVYQVTLPPSVAEYIRELGTPIGSKQGNLSDGIRKLAEWYKSKERVND